MRPTGCRVRGKRMSSVRVRTERILINQRRGSFKSSIGGSALIAMRRSPFMRRLRIRRIFRRSLISMRTSLRKSLSFTCSAMRRNNASTRHSQESQNGSQSTARLPQSNRDKLIVSNTRKSSTCCKLHRRKNRLPIARKSANSHQATTLLRRASPALRKKIDRDAISNWER